MTIHTKLWYCSFLAGWFLCPVNLWRWHTSGDHSVENSSAGWSQCQLCLDLLGLSALAFSGFQKMILNFSL